MLKEARIVENPLPIFKDGQIVRQTPHYAIVMGYKGQQEEAGRQRFFIIPLDKRADAMLKSAVKLHHIPTEKRDEVTAIRMDWSADNWLNIVTGDNLFIPNEDMPDTVPTLKRMEQLLRRGKAEYSFPPAQIRKMEARDLDAVITLGLTTPEFHTGTDAAQFYFRETLERLVESDHVLLVANVVEDIAGFIIAEYSPDFRDGHIHTIAVSQNHRGKGIGLELIEETLGILEDKGSNHVYALINTQNEAALAFTRNVEFEIGEEKFVFAEMMLPRKS